MKKRLSLALCLTLLLSLALPALAADVVRSPQKLSVDGSAADCEVYNIGGYNYFKLRDIAMLLRATGSRFSVDWDEQAQTIRVVTGAEYVPVGGELVKGADKSDTAVPSRQTLMIDGTRSSLSAWNIGDNNFFQLRALGDVLNFKVDYDSATRTMLVDSVS